MKLYAAIQLEISLRAYVKASLGNVSVREARDVLMAGGCRVNGIVERFGSTKLRVNDKVTIDTSIKPPTDLSMDLLFEDKFYSVFEKPSGMTTTPANGYRLSHRLDKGTSGVICMAKTTDSKKKLDELFRLQKVSKQYIAVIHGIPGKDEGKVQAPILQVGACHGQKIHAVHKDGKQSITYWEVIRKFKNSSIVALYPLTGRHHQLRVHMVHIGHPIVGDTLYARELPSLGLYRLALHAQSLSFPHPFSGRTLSIQSRGIPLDIFGSTIGEKTTIY